MAVKPYPKSLGACADLLFDLKTERLAADKVAAELKSRETALTDHIIEKLPKGDAGAVGKHHKVIVSTKDVPQVAPDQWEDFYKYVSKNKAWDLVQRRLSTEAIRARLEAGKTIPGVKLFKAVVVSLTKV
jgi:hypothetical protein